MLLSRGFWIYFNFFSEKYYNQYIYTTTKSTHQTTTTKINHY